MERAKGVKGIRNCLLPGTKRAFQYLEFVFVLNANTQHAERKHEHKSKKYNAVERKKL